MAQLFVVEAVVPLESSKLHRYFHRGVSIGIPGFAFYTRVNHPPSLEHLWIYKSEYNWVSSSVSIISCSHSSVVLRETFSSPRQKRRTSPVIGESISFEGGASTGYCFIKVMISYYIHRDNLGAAYQYFVARKMAQDLPYRQEDLSENHPSFSSKQFNSLHMSVTTTKPIIFQRVSTNRITGTW